jgi:excisionase family DNA binding protein
VVATGTEELLSLPEAAEPLGVSVYTVRRWIKDGKLKAFKPGKEYRVREADLEEFLAAREVRPKAVASPSQRRLFNGEERRASFIERWRQGAEARVAFYDDRLAAVERGGLFPGFGGAKTLQDDAFEDFSTFCYLSNGELAERWHGDPEVPEAVKEELVFELVEVQKVFLQVVGRIGDAVKELAETEPEKEEAERRDEQHRERTRDIGKSA